MTPTLDNRSTSALAPREGSLTEQASRIIPSSFTPSSYFLKLAKRDERLPDFAHTEPFTWSIGLQ